MNTGPEILERLSELRDSGLHVFDDLNAHRERLDRVTKRAAEIITAAEDDSITDQQRAEIPVLLADLELLLKAQMDYSGIIAQIDRKDGSYDNAPVDEQLRMLIRQIRNYNVELNHWFGTKTTRKILGWAHDLPKWFTIRWRQAVDYLKQASITVGTAGTLAGLGVVAGYSIYHGGLGAGLSALGSHVSSGWKRAAGFLGGGK
jgi:hypothetical protein